MATPFSTESQKESGISARVLLIAAAAVIILVALLAVLTLRHAPTDTGQVAAADAYASHIILDGIELSEATNGTGGKVTYVDGTVKNTGTRVLTAATLQVAFGSDDSPSPQRQTVPLTLVRTRQPYVDIEPVAAEPIRPGEVREFRLIFDTVPANWNTKAPELRVIHADLR